MAKAAKSLDVDESLELLRLIEEVRDSDAPRVLRHGQEDVAVIRPIKRTVKVRAPRGRPADADDPLWRLVGAGASSGPSDVSSRKHAYLADTDADRHG